MIDGLNVYQSWYCVELHFNSLQNILIPLTFNAAGAKTTTVPMENKKWRASLGSFHWKEISSWGRCSCVAETEEEDVVLLNYIT